MYGAHTHAMSERGIDRAKPKTLVRIKFGAGAYDVYVSTVSLMQRLIVSIPDYAELVLHYCATKALSCKLVGALTEIRSNNE